MRTTTQTRQGHGMMPGEKATGRSHSKDHPLSSIRPVPSGGHLKRETEGQLSLHAPASGLGMRSHGGIPNRNNEDRLRVLDQFPGNRSPFVGRHHVVVGNRSGGGRRSHHLPDTALWAAFTSPCRRTEWQTSHESPPLSGEGCCDASRLLARFASRMLMIDTEPQGSLFADRRSQRRFARPAGVTSACRFIFTPLGHTLST